jgi:hypothetical protein
MWIEGSWPNLWPAIWPNFETPISSRVISRFQEIYKATQYVSSDSVILNTNVTSDIISMMDKIVDALFEETDRATEVKALITEKFITTNGVKADLMTIRNFVDELQILVNS